MTEGSVNLRHEIDSAGDLRSIVRTMKALAASSIGQYEASVGALADYYKTVLLGLNVCLRHGAPGDGSLKTGSGGRPARGGVIVFGSDQGLVGRFNETVSALTLQSAIIGSKNALVWAVGERVHDLLDGAGVLLQGQYSVPASVGAIVPLVGRLLVDSGVDGDIAELWLFYNRPLAGAGYEAVSERLLPLDVDWMRRMTDISWPTASLPEVSGNLFETLRGLIGEYLFVTIFRACAASLASENASRLAAMQRADQNIDELLDRLRRTSQRIRQSSIDDELFDVFAGFEALSPEGRRPLQVRCRTECCAALAQTRPSDGPQPKMGKTL